MGDVGEAIGAVNKDVDCGGHGKGEEPNKFPAKDQDAEDGTEGLPDDGDRVPGGLDGGGKDSGCPDD